MIHERCYQCIYGSHLLGCFFQCESSRFGKYFYLKIPHDSNLLTVPPGKPGKYGSRSYVRASANLWNSLRGERAAWLQNSPTVESFKINLKTDLFCERFLS